MHTHVHRPNALSLLPRCLLSGVGRRQLHSPLWGLPGGRAPGGAPVAGCRARLPPSCEQPLTPSCCGCHPGQAPYADLTELRTPPRGAEGARGSSGLPVVPLRRASTRVALSTRLCPGRQIQERLCASVCVPVGLLSQACTPEAPGSRQEGLSVCVQRVACMS